MFPLDNYDFKPQVKDETVHVQNGSTQTDEKIIKGLFLSISFTYYKLIADIFFLFFIYNFKNLNAISVNLRGNM